MYGTNLERRIFDKSLYEVDMSEIHKLINSVWNKEELPINAILVHKLA
jgi:hypothetical protein